MPSASACWSDRLDGHFESEHGLVSCPIDCDRWLMQNVLWPSWHQPGKSPTRPCPSFVHWRKEIKDFLTLYIELTSFRNPSRLGAKCKEGMVKLQFSIKVWIYLVHHRRERKLLQTSSKIAYQPYSMVNFNDLSWLLVIISRTCYETGLPVSVYLLDGSVWRTDT